MDMLQISLLGSPQITWMNQPYTIPRRTSRALLFFLASHPSPVPRSQILTTFWSESSEKAARAQLRDHLGKLRSSLPIPDMLLADINQVSINFDLVQVDVVDYLKALNKIGRTPWKNPDTQPLSDDLYQLMAHAVRQWRTSSFLTGISIPDTIALDDWISETEQNLLITRENLLQRLISHCEAIQSPIAILEWIRSAIITDPYNEELHIKLIKSLAISGNLGEALKHGNNVKQIFERDLSEKPSPQFFELLDSLKRNDKKKDLNHTAAHQNDLAVFVGREEEIHQLLVSEESGKVSIVLGETGIGKTRLVHEFFHRSSRTNRLLVAPSYFSTHGIPFQPLIAMARSDLESQGLARLRNEDRLKLLSLDATINPILYRDSASEIPDDTIIPVNELFLRYFQVLTENKKILLLLDDYQWADQATIQLIMLLISRKLIPQRINLIITSDMSRRHKGQDELIMFLEDRDMLSRVTPRQFSTSEESLLVENILGKKLNQNQLEVLHTHTDGNPLLVIETTRSPYFSDSQLSGLPGMAAIPRNIHSFLRERYNHLSPDLKQVLSISAIFGAPITIDLIEEVTQISPDGIVEAVEELEQMGIFKSVEQSSSHTIAYHFGQNIFKEVILMELSPTRKRYLHRRIAQALKQTPSQPDNSRAALLAFHHTSSGDLISAFNEWKNAAKFARRLSSPADAVHAYQEAESLLPLIELQLDDHTIQRFYGDWANLAYEMQDIDNLKQVSAAIGKIGERRSSALLLGSSHFFSALNKFSTQEYYEGLILIDQAIRYLAESEDLVVLLQALDRKSKFLYLLNRFNEAKFVLEENIAMLPGQLDNELLAIASGLYHDYAYMLIMMGSPALGMEFAEKAQRAYIAANDLDGQARVFAQMAICSVYSSENIKAEQEAELGLNLARKTEHLRIQTIISTYAAIAKACRGKMDEAWDLAEQSKSTSHTIQFPDIAAFSYQTQGDICRYLVDYAEAADLYKMGLKSGVEGFHKSDLLSRLGLAVGLQGNLTQGFEHLDEAYKLCTDFQIGSYILVTKVHYYILDPSRRKLESGEAELHELLKEAELIKLTSYASIIQLLLCRLAYYRGDLHTGADLFHTAIHAPIQIEGIWPSLIYQILLQNPPESVPTETRLFWKTTALQYLDAIASACSSKPMKKRWQLFYNTIDKIDCRD